MAYFRCTGAGRVTISLTLTLHGAKGDNIAIYDKDFSIVGSAIFDADTTSKEITLDVIPNETYAFMSSISKALDGSTLNYSKSVILNKNVTDVYVMPESAIYWYGNSVVSFDKSLSAVGSGIYENNDILMDNNTASAYSMCSLSKFDLSGHTHVKAMADDIQSYSGSSNGHLAITSDRSWSAWDAGAFFILNGNITPLIDIDVTNYQSDYHIKFNAIGCRYKLRAVWAEQEDYYGQCKKPA